MGAKPAEDPGHTKTEGCRYVYGEGEVIRRRRKELGQNANVGPCRDPAIPTAGVVDGNPIIDDNLDLDHDADGAISAPGVISTPVDEQVIT